MATATKIPMTKTQAVSTQSERYSGMNCASTCLKWNVLHTGSVGSENENTGTENELKSAGDR